MSLIAAKIDRENKKLEMSSDTILMMGNRKYTTDKIEVITKNFVIGMTGEYRLMKTLSDEIRKTYDISKDKSPYDETDYLFYLFNNAYKKVAKENDIEHEEFAFLVFFRGELYKVYNYKPENKNENDIQLLEMIPVNRDFDAEGFGEDYAVCAMYLGKNTKEAIEIAYEFSTNINNKVKTIEVNYGNK